MTLSYFGTDGIRGRAFQAPLTLAETARWGRAWGHVAAANGISTLILGWDPRSSSVPLAQSFVQGLLDVNITILGMVPTPAVAWHTARTAGAWGVMLSASHNPPEDNGIKGFNASGEKLTEAQELAIEAAFDAADVLESTLPLLHTEQGPMEAYLAHLNGIELPENFPVVVDCAHGATAPFAPRLIRGNVSWIGVPSDGARINVGTGSTHLDALRDAVKQSHSALGIAFDGDGDRCLMVDPHGQLIDGDQMLWLLAQDRLDRHETLPGVVGTVMTNGALEAALNARGVPFVRTPVGDKYLLRELASRDWDLAAEASGHVIQKKLGPSGDGLATALAILGALIQRLPAERWNWRFEPWPLRLVNLQAAARIPIENCLRLQAAIRDLESRHGADLRLVIRWSGTEPKLRLMAEAKTEGVLAEAIELLETSARLDLERA